MNSNIETGLEKTKITQNKLKLKKELKAMMKSGNANKFSSKQFFCLESSTQNSGNPNYLMGAPSRESKYGYELQDINLSFQQAYQMGKKIGAGSQSIVNQCTSRKTEKSYAVKLVRKINQQVQQQIKETVEILQEINHPNIVKVHDLFIQKTTRKCMIITQLCEYKDLRYYINQHKVNKTQISLDEIISIIQKLFNTLDYLKSKKVCHRDIKPQNILYNPKNGELKLIDFQIARRSKDEDEMLDLWSDAGSTYYRAPESFKGGYDQKVDIWAVGVILFQMLTGYLPFFSQYQCEIKKKICSFRIDFSKIACPQNLSNLLKGLLEKDPVARMTPIQALVYLHRSQQSKTQMNASTNSSLSQNIHQKQAEEQSFFFNQYQLSFLFNSISPTRKRSSSC